jgi:large subunit ribosomal protein L1
MGQTKKELIEQAKTLGIEVDAKAKVADIKALIAAHDTAPVAEEAIQAAEQEGDVITEKRSTEVEPIVAKAGKRSAKSLKEVAEKEAKEERKHTTEETPEKPKLPVKPARSRLERRGKGFRKSAEAIEKGKQYSLEEAIGLAQKTSHVKFDATVELHVNLGVDPRHADQNIRDNLVLPAGTGKTVTVAVLTDDPAAAKKAGADIAGTDDLFAQLDKGNLNFDVLIATPALMPKLGKYARVLGPRGLMPNPKSGTVTPDVEKGVAEAKAGRVEYRVDSAGIIHLGVGKVSFTTPQLLENVQAVMASVKANKPSSVKGNYLKAVFLTTSMGPSVAVDVANLG